MVKDSLEKALISLVLVLLVAILTYSDALWRVDRWLYDGQLKLLAQPASADIVVIEVDQKSLNALGRWPWSRDTHARLLQHLASLKTRAIGLDFVFSEVDTEHPQRDEQLSRALASSKSVVLPLIIEQNGLAPVASLPLPAFAQYALLGHANVDVDADGLSRSVPLQMRLGESQWPAMALALYGIPHPEIYLSLPGLHTPVSSNGTAQQWDKDYQVWLPFYAKGSDFTRVSYIDVLKGLVADSYFTDKFVLVGLTARGIEREIPAPLIVGNRAMSGVDFVAAALDGLIKQKLWQPLPLFNQLCLTLLVVASSIGISRQFSQRWLPLVVISLCPLIVLLAILVLHTSDHWYPPASALCTVLFSYPLRSWRHFEKLIQSLFTERKRAYVALNAIVDPVLTTSSQGVINYMNSAAQDMLGAVLHQAPQPQLDALFTLEVAGKSQTFNALIQQSILLHGPLKFSYCRLYLANQQTWNVNLVVAPLFGNKGMLQGAIITLTDISERILMAKLLLQRTEERTAMMQLMDHAEQANQAKTQFLSHMSHELRTPLNAIIGFAQLLKMDDPEYPLAETHLESVNEIYKAGLHLLDIIDELLDLARIESGKISLDMRSVPLSELLHDCQAIIAPLVDQHSLELRINNSLPESMLLKVDPKRAKQILLNFLSNAVKYNCPKGRITLLCQQPCSDRIRISVIDTGSGLSDEQQHMLFQSFERLDADKNHIAGTGIGLVISKQLAELMSGQVGVSSRQGVGSTFWVEFLLEHNQPRF